MTQYVNERERKDRSINSYLTAIIAASALFVGAVMGVGIAQAMDDSPSRACDVALDKGEEIIVELGNFIELQSEMVSLGTEAISAAMNQDNKEVGRIGERMDSPSQAMLAKSTEISNLQLSYKQQVANCKGN